jgi:hypothetical protein
MQGKRCSVFSAALAAAGALLALSLPASAAPAEYAAIRFLPNQEPAVYLQCQDDTIRIASSIAGLENAKPIKAPRSRRFQFDAGPNEMVRGHSFAETDLPVAIEGVSRVSVSLHVQRTYRLRRTGSEPGRTTVVSGQFRLSRQDRSGAVWTYGFFANGREPATADPAQAPMMDVPDLDKLALKVETKVEGKKVRIGLRVMAGESWVSEITKGSANAPAQIQVANQAGKAILSEKGDVKKFGFT